MIVVRLPNRVARAVKEAIGSASCTDKVMATAYYIFDAAIKAQMRQPDSVNREKT